MTQISTEIFHSNADLAVVDSNAIRGAFRSKVASIDALTSISFNLLKAYSTFVYVDTDTATEGWYYYTGDGSTNVAVGAEGTTWAKLNDLFTAGSMTGIVAASNTSNTATVALTGSEGISLGFTDGTPDTIDIELTNATSFDDNKVLKWDNDTDQFVNSTIVEDDSGNITLGSGTVTIGTLSVTTINAANSYTSASITTSDTFIRLADPSADFSDAGAGAAVQAEYAQAQHAGFVINTGYYDDNAGGSAGEALSTHKLLYWNKDFLRWVVQDGTPEKNVSAGTDTLINAENDFAGGVGRRAGTMKFLESFFVPDAQALHFGLDATFSFNHFDGANDPSIDAGTTDKFMKTQYVVDPKTMFEFASFTQAAVDIVGGGNAHQVDYSWDDNDTAPDDDAANIMSNTFLRTARMFKAKVVLEAEDILTSGTDKKIKVYHGGIFNGARELPVVKVYRKSSGSVEGTNFVYEEIMVKVLITDATDYFEIVFNPGFLVTDTTLYVRALY